MGRAVFYLFPVRLRGFGERGAGAFMEQLILMAAG